MTISYSSAEVARILNLTETELRTCLRAALFPSHTKRRPKRFSFQDLLLLKTTRGLWASKIPVARIRRILELLKRELPADRMLCNVKIYADGRRIVVSDGSVRWQPDSGQFVFNFDALDSPTPMIRPRLRGRQERTAQDWMAIGLELQQTSPREAEAAYRQAVAMDPRLMAAHINLGYIQQQLGAFDAAQASYQAAIDCGPDEVLGYFYLAALLDERGDRHGATQAYRKVVELQPDSAEAHYHLAKVYEAEGQQTHAIRHFAAAKKLLDRHRPRGGFPGSSPKPRPLPAD